MQMIKHTLVAHLYANDETHMGSPFTIYMICASNVFTAPISPPGHNG